MTTTCCTQSDSRSWKPKEDDGKVLYPGPDKAGNLLEVVTVRRDDATEIAIHAMKMRRMYEPLLRETGGTDD